ncbi:hypothetical protein LCGC14_2500800 [marine sediment metagenome]|uniref:Uncharacterized protein n=1 Tax=marine sediment metagenome TaxID=412755 RepID=A0A0F9B1V8_9ZZZZ
MDEFLALTVALSALTVLDVELTQRCLAHGICHEGNPLLPERRRIVHQGDDGGVEIMLDGKHDCSLPQ